MRKPRRTRAGPAAGRLRYDGRMNVRRVLLSVAAVGLLAVAGAAWWLYASMDALVKRAIEHWGPEITGVAVRVDAVKLEPAQGRGAILGLVVGSPKGYQAPHALALGEMRLTIDAASLAKDVVVIRELVLVAPDVVYERGPGGDNMAAIQKNVDAWVAAHGGGAKADAGPGKKFIIETLRIEQGRAHFGTAASLPMPDLVLHDIGRKTNGATAGEAVKEVWSAMVRGVGNLAQRAGAAVKDAATGAFEGAKRLFK